MSQQSDPVPYPPLAALLPPLAPSEYCDLVTSIERLGMLTPVLVDPQGRILDGHHRVEAWSELREQGLVEGLCPTHPCEAAADTVAGLEVAFAANCIHRRLTRDQRKRLALKLVQAFPAILDGWVGAATGFASSTIGKWRQAWLDKGLVPFADRHPFLVAREPRATFSLEWEPSALTLELDSLVEPAPDPWKRLPGEQRTGSSSGVSWRSLLEPLS